VLFIYQIFIRKRRDIDNSRFKAQTVFNISLGQSVPAICFTDRKLIHGPVAAHSLNRLN